MIGRRITGDSLGENLLVLEYPNRIDDRLRIVASTRHDLAAQAVCLQFHLAPVAGNQQRRDRIGHVAHQFAASGGDSGNGADGFAGDVRDPTATHVVADHMADFVPDDGGQLSLGFQKHQQAAADEDVSVPRGEGVYLIAIEDVKMVFLASILGVRQ